MQKRRHAVNNEQMTKRSKLASNKIKVALTKTISVEENQIIVSQGQANSIELAQGELMSYQYDQGIYVHGGLCTELVDSDIVAPTPPALLITILLSGRLSFSYDNLKFELNANEGPKGVVVNLTKPTNFRRTLSKHNVVNKINVLIKPKWLAARLTDNCHHYAFLQHHQAFYDLDINPNLISLTSKVASLQPHNFAEKIELESLIAQLIHHACIQLPDNFHQSKANHIEEGLASYKDQRIEDIISYIENHLDQNLTLASIAEAFAMSISNLQRRFKQQLDMTVNGYIRHRRLNIARQHLQQGLVSITEAAYEAGYLYPSNFTHAFRKEFGFAPYQLDMAKDKC